MNAQEHEEFLDEACSMPHGVDDLIGRITRRLRGIVRSRSDEGDPLLETAARIVRALPALARPQPTSRIMLARLVYLAQTVHLRRHGRTISDDPIEATNYGPLHPRLMAEMRKGLASAIEGRGDALDVESLESIDETIDLYGGHTHARLAAIVHGGAWKKRYDASRVGGTSERGARMSASDILMQMREDDRAEGRKG